MQKCCKIIKMPAPGLEILNNLVPETHRVWASSLSAPAKASFIFPYISLYNENAPKIIEKALART